MRQCHECIRLDQWRCHLARGRANRFVNKSVWTRMKGGRLPEKKVEGARTLLLGWVLLSGWRELLVVNQNSPECIIVRREAKLISLRLLLLARRATLRHWFTPSDAIPELCSLKEEWISEIWVLCRSSKIQEQERRLRLRHRSVDSTKQEKKLKKPTRCCWCIGIYPGSPHIFTASMHKRTQATKRVWGSWDTHAFGGTATFRFFSANTRHTRLGS